MSAFDGLSAFPITPADSDGRVDSAALGRLVNRLVQAEVDSIGLLGSTGAYMYFDRGERRRAIEVAMDEVSGKTPVIVGIGALRTDEALKLAQDAKALGAAAGLLAPVSYTPLTDEEVFDHYTVIARKSGLPIVIYDNPITTHFRFSPELVGRLAKEPNVIAVKRLAGTPEETAADMTRLRGLVPSGFSLGYSADVNSTEAMIAGADTWYSVVAGILPKASLRIVRAAQAGEAAEARRLNAAMSPLWDLFKQYSSIRVVYALAEVLGVCGAEPPLPIQSLSKGAKAKIAEVYAQLPKVVAE